MKYAELIKRMTLEEKASLMSGKDFWQSVNIDRVGIPSIFFADGPHGIRKQAGSADHLGLNPSLKATCFPTAATVANSWNPELGEEIGRCLGEEAASQGVHVLLGPGLNMKRSPLCGRNFEYFSEDPYLAGKMAAAYIRGIQENGVAACPKHFAANSQELRRMSTNSVVDERTLREIYLTGFEIAVKEGKAKTLMSAYNQVNGVYANENEHLLQEILRDEWGFDGFVVSDWGGSNDHAAGVAAGSHVEMPSTSADGVRELVRAVEDGRLLEEKLDQRVDELLTVLFALYEAVKPQIGQPVEEEVHHAAAQKAAEESIVLLKNQDAILPLRKGMRVAVIGDFAGQPRYQGAGSSMVNPTRLDDTLSVFEKSGLELVGYAQGFERGGAGSQKLLKEAVELAKQAEVVLLYLGLDEQRESEGRDREDMKLAKNQIAVLKAVAEANPNVVVVLSAGAAIEMPWTGHAKAIVHGYLSGQAGAKAMLRVLNGEVCPSGRLSETYPLKYEDTPAYHYYPGKEYSCEYREGLYIGYRYYETAGLAVKYPFGYGLSYTTFEYSDMKISDRGIEVMVRNTGTVDGAEVVQMYVGRTVSDVYRPKKELKGFQKVWLKAGEEKTVCIPFDDKTFRYYDTECDAWKVESGEYAIMVGAHVRDIRVRGTYCVSEQPDEVAERCRKNLMPSYWSGNIQNVGDDEFRVLLGHEIPDGRWKSGAPLGLNDAFCQMKYAKSMIAKFLFFVLETLKKRNKKKENPDLNILFVYNMPFRGLAKMTGGMISMDMAKAILDMVNGHLGRGLKNLAAGYFSNERAKKKARRRRNG